MYLWLKEWRDAFDPNSTKSSRNQVWIQTFTISPPTDSKDGKNTYLMSMSGKSEDHSIIDKIYSEEIRLLTNTGKMFYHGGRNEMIKVKLGKLIICVDRPGKDHQCFLQVIMLVNIQRCGVMLAKLMVR